MEKERERERMKTSNDPFTSLGRGTKLLSAHLILYMCVATGWPFSSVTHFGDTLTSQL